MNFDEQSTRRNFRLTLRELGVEEVRYRLASGKFGTDKAALVNLWLADLGTPAEFVDTLDDLVSTLKTLRERFVKGGSLSGYFLRTEDEATFEAAFLEIQMLLNDCFGANNLMLQKVIQIYSSGRGGFSGGISFAAIEQLISIMAVIRKKLLLPTSKVIDQTHDHSNDLTYIDAGRIAEIASLPSGTWDFVRLHRMCEELNIAFRNSSFLSVAFLIRAILDHVPPVFGETSFAAVASSIAGKSNKQLMLSLQNTSRQIGDKWLHTLIRQQETLPNATQVDARQALDVLLSEVIKNAKP